jgi:hypothetical protein
MRAVHVLFYRPQTDDHWINHLVSFFSPPFSHCDIQFEDGLASSIYSRESVYLQQKRFSRLNYERISLTMTDDEYAQVMAFCKQAHSTKVQFDLPGMLMSYMPMGSVRREGLTYCSRYIAEALQASLRKDFSNMRTGAVSPSSLYRTLKEQHRSFVYVAANRLDQLSGKLHTREGDPEL